MGLRMRPALRPRSRHRPASRQGALGLLGICDGDDTIENELLLDVIIDEKRLRDGSRVCQPCCLNNDRIELGNFGVEILERDHEVATHCAADAAIHHLNDLLIGLLREDPFVHTNVTKLILDDGESLPVVRIVQNVIEERRFPRAKKAREDGHGDFASICNSSHGVLICVWCVRLYVQELQRMLVRA